MCVCVCVCVHGEHGSVNSQTERQTDRRKGRETERQRDRRKDRRKDDRQTERQTDGKQTDRDLNGIGDGHTHTHYHYHYHTYTTLSLSLSHTHYHYHYHTHTHTLSHTLSHTHCISPNSQNKIKKSETDRHLVNATLERHTNTLCFFEGHLLKGHPERSQKRDDTPLSGERYPLVQKEVTKANPQSSAWYACSC